MKRIFADSGVDIGAHGSSLQRRLDPEHAWNPVERRFISSDLPEAQHRRIMKPFKRRIIAMDLRRFAAIVFLLIGLQPGTAFALPGHPIFCDEIHVKVCRPPAVVGGVYPHCFCSIDALRPSDTKLGPALTGSKVALSCQNKCSRNALTCRSVVAKMCNPLHHPCDDAGLQAQQEAGDACESTYQDCSATCAQPSQ